MARITSLLFIVPVRDLDRAARFYKDAFDLEVVFRNEGIAFAGIPGTDMSMGLPLDPELAGELPRSETDLWRIIDATAALLETLPTTPDCYGMVHFDLSGDNVVWRAAEPAAIDFDDCMWHWCAGDIARTLVYFRENDGGRIGARETAFVAGYQEVRPLDARWLDLLPEFVRLALISELAWMAYSSRAEGYGTVFTAEQETNLRRAIADYRRL